MSAVPRVRVSSSSRGRARERPVGADAAAGSFVEGEQRSRVGTSRVRFGSRPEAERQGEPG